MTDIAISARDLGKQYKLLGRGGNPDSLRDVITGAVGGLFKKPSAEEIAKSSFWALRNASFDIRRGENVGIIGLNGAGKSTLLKVLSRIVTPTTGQATINGRLGALLEVGTGFHPELTGRENAFLYGAILGMPRSEVARKFDAIVDFAEIGEFIDMPVKRYSSGMYVRLAFAVAAHLDPDILLLDEVLAVGDFTFQRKCMNFARSLEQRGSTILFVSHNMFSIKSMCSRVIYLKKGQIVYDGPMEEGLKKYENDSRLAEAPWFRDDSRKKPAITVVDVSLRNEAGEESTVFEYGERMNVRIHYKAFERVERPDFRVGFNRADDVHCHTYSTTADDVDLPFVEGEGVVDLRTPPLKLVSDLYTLTLSVRERGYGRMLSSQIGATFHVKHDVYASNAFGVFHEAGQWRHVAGAAQKAETSDELR
jgi:lipopolysaccharide transport system ATP-binding protein